MRRPGDVVDGCGVERDVVDLLPGATLFAPNEDLAIVRRRSENVAILGVRPSYTPYSALMTAKLSTTCRRKVHDDIPLQCLDQPVGFALDLEDLDCLV